MMPAGPLMIEHRLIEKVVAVLAKELERIKRRKKADIRLIDAAVDAMKMYADRCHHGKEEDVLFRDLKKKPLNTELSRILHELIDEHGISRRTIAALVLARDAYMGGRKEAMADIEKALQVVTRLYPAHIEKEDKRFFLPCMEYFSAEEQAQMLVEFDKFDRALIHEKYKKVLADLERWVEEDS